MRIALLLLCALATPALANQTIWKWVDERGVTHYSDRPVPGATRLEISTSTPRPTTDDTSRSYSSSTPTPPPAQDAAPATTYTRFEVARPQANDTIVNTGGEVQVGLLLEPGLNPAHSIALYMDSRLVSGFPPTALSHTLTEVPRGTHSLVAVVQDGRGRRIQETRPVSFTVRQESSAQPPVGPSLRPPPKPSPRGAANKLPNNQPSYAALNSTPPKIDPQTNLPAKPAPPPGGPKRGN
jgi:hypothetical protein